MQAMGTRNADVSTHSNDVFIRRQTLNVYSGGVLP